MICILKIFRCINTFKKTNTPNYLLSISAGINLSNYFNDKFLDNSPFDIGEVSGEYDIYGSSSGIGYNFNSELEVPLNSNFSYLFGLSYIKSNFNSSGIVEEFCYKSDSTKFYQIQIILLKLT